MEDLFQFSELFENQDVNSGIGGVNIPPRLKHQFMSHKVNALTFLN